MGVMRTCWNGIIYRSTKMEPFTKWRCLSGLMLISLSSMVVFYGVSNWRRDPQLLPPSPESLTARRLCELNGSAVGFCCPGVPCSYTDHVDLRIIILVYNRADSLLKVLTSINKLEMDGDTLSVEVWIDVNRDGDANKKTVQLAREFTLEQGPVRTHIQLNHAGIYGQWIDSWRPGVDSKELALILEDDVDISPYAYRWLKAASSFYKYREDIGGISIFEGAIVLMSELPTDVAFLHQRLGTQGFAPHPIHWRKFQDWYHAIKFNESFHPYVANDEVTTNWYKGFEETGETHTMWEMWWIYYADVNKLWTLYSNLAAHMYSQDISFDNATYLAYHRQEAGLHFSEDTARNSRGRLITEWDDKYIHFTKAIPEYSYNATRA